MRSERKMITVCQWFYCNVVYGVSAGIFDLIGNVWEWTNDWYDEKYYQRSPSQDPPGPESGTQRVLRSASWYNGAAFMRASFHAAGGLVGRSVLVGFRCGGDVFAP